MQTGEPSRVFSKVAMLCHGSEVYGIGTIQRLYAAGAPGMAFVCFERGPMWEWLERNNIRRLCLEGVRPYVPAASSARTLMRLPGMFFRARGMANRLAEFAHSEGISILHTHWMPHQVMTGLARSPGLRTVWQINNNTNRQRLGGLGVKLNHAMARWGADVLLPASDYIKATWDGCGVRQVTILNSAELQAGDDGTGLPGEDLPDHPLRCVIAGRLEESKGHHVAVEAVLMARRAGHDVTLDIYGGPLDGNPYSERLMELVREAGAHGTRGTDPALQFHGFRTDLRSKHRSYHVALQCRLDPEPCSLWVCETLVDGLVSIASATGGTPELVQDGVTGYLYPSGDVEAVARRLCELAAAPEKVRAMRRAARARGLREFTRDRMMAQTLAEYARLLGEH